MIRPCREDEFETIREIIEDGARKYKGAIPTDCWKEPYMPADELRREIADGVVFWGYEDAGELAGVMGVQDVKGVTLIRHAYVRTTRQRQGIGEQLLKWLCARATRPVLLGTWAAAAWAIQFYQKHGFQLVPASETPALLRKYWTIGPRQIETSVVLRR